MAEVKSKKGSILAQPYGKSEVRPSILAQPYVELHEHVLKGIVALMKQGTLNPFDEVGRVVFIPPRGPAPAFPETPMGDPCVAVEKVRTCLPKSISELLEEIRCHTEQADTANVAVVRLENLKIAAEEKENVRETLGTFIGVRMTSERVKDQIALRSAIRKYVFLHTLEQLESLRGLLETPRLRLENRIEILKTLTRLLTWRPPSRGDACPGLSNAIFQSSDKYFDPDFLEIPTVGLVAFDALFSLLLLGSPHAILLLGKARGAPGWFVAQVRHDAVKLRDRLQSQGRGSSGTLGMLNEAAKIDRRATEEANAFI